MKKIFQSPVFIVQFLLLPLALFSQHENYHAVYLSLMKEYTLNPDGSMDFRYVKKQKLQTYRAFHSLYGETFIAFSSDRQELKINQAFTTMADGKTIPVPENAFNLVLPFFAADAPAYNSLREMVITHTGLERGAIINLDYQIHSQKGFYPALMGNELFTESEPIEEHIIKVKIPAGEKLYYKTINTTISPVVTSEQGFQVYTWRLTNIPAMSSEEAQQDGNESYPRLLFSTSGNREEVFKNMTAREAFQYSIPEEIKKEVNTILAESSGKLNTVLKLQEKVVNDLRLYPILPRTVGYTSRNSEQIWNDNGGTALEKTILFISLLRAAGIEAEPVAIVRTSFYDDKIGTFADIEDFAVKVDLKTEGTIYFPATNLNNQDLLLSLPGRTLITFGRNGKISCQETGDPEQNITVQGQFICSSDPKMTGELTVNLRGAVNPFLGLQRDKNKIKKWLSGGITSGDINDVKVTEFKPGEAFQTFIVQADKPFVKDTFLYFFTIPILSSGIDSWNIKTLSSKRETAYELPSLAEEKYVYEIRMPDGLEVLYPETEINISNKAGKFIFESKMIKDKLTVKKEIVLNKRVIGPEWYQDFKAILDAWNNPGNRKIVFKATN